MTVLAKSRSSGSIPRGSQLRRPYRARSGGRRGWLVSISPRIGSASIPKVDYDKTLNAVQQAVDGYPGIYRDVQTYLRERIKEVLNRPAGEISRGAHLRPGSGRTCAGQAGHR